MPSPDHFWTLYIPFGDTALAGMYGTSAALIGTEAWAANVDGTKRVPEAMPSYDLFQAAQGYSPGSNLCDRLGPSLRALIPGCASPDTSPGGGGGDGGSGAAPWCDQIPIPFRYMLAPCVGAAAGEAAKNKLIGGGWWIPLLAIGIILIGAVTIVK